MCKTWPEMDTLIPLGGNLITPAQEALLRQRYDEHAGEYTLPDQFVDGLPINACMVADTVNDIEEEIVDAVFNCLVLLFKLRNYQNHTRRNAERLLDLVLLAWDRIEPVR